MTTEKLDFLDPRELVLISNIRHTRDERADHWLDASIKEVGILQPIRVLLSDGKYFVIAGSRRTLSAIRLGLEKVPCVVGTRPLTEAESIQHQLITNGQWKNLTPGEQAATIRHLMTLTNWTASDAAERLGMSTSKLAKLLPILGLPRSILDRVNDRSIPASCAYELSKITDPVKQAAMAEKVQSGTFTRDALIRAMHTPKSKNPTRRNRLVRKTATLEGQRTVAVSGPGLDFDGFITALKEVLGTARRERSRGIGLDTFVKLLSDRNATAKESEEDA